MSYLFINGEKVSYDPDVSYKVLSFVGGKCDFENFNMDSFAGFILDEKTSDNMKRTISKMHYNKFKVFEDKNDIDFLFSYAREKYGENTQEYANFVDNVESASKTFGVLEEILKAFDNNNS